MRMKISGIVCLLAALASVPCKADAITKWSLWSNGTRLRGANIYQRLVYPKLDAPGSLGAGPVGPPYTQQDFDRLAAMGANYVNISHPGLFREKPPYKLNPAIQNNLDRLIGMIAKANMFAVISFRTGPGRSEFTFFFDDAGTWFSRSYLNDNVWKQKDAQDAWGAMWKYTAERYRNNPVVVGYDLMVEPNSNHVWFNVFDPQQFYPNYSGTLYDWNQFFPRIIQRIRESDQNTPILVGALDYSAVSWLPYLQPAADSKTIYAVHQYEPFQYTTQMPPFDFKYPGLMDLNFDGNPDLFNRAWLNGFLNIVNRFKQNYRATVASNEFGVMRWEPGGSRFVADEMDLFEQRRMNYALWIWSGSWPRIVDFDDFDFTHGPDPDNHVPVASNLLGSIQNAWKRNRLRPSNVTFTDITGPATPLCCGGFGEPAVRKPARLSRFPLPHTRHHKTN